LEPWERLEGFLEGYERFSGRIGRVFWRVQGFSGGVQCMLGGCVINRWREGGSNRLLSHNIETGSERPLLVPKSNA